MRAAAVLRTERPGPPVSTTKRARDPRRPRPKRVGPLRIDPVARRVFAHRTEVPVSPREIALLWILAASAGETVSRQELVDRLYGTAREPESNVVDVLICTLRKKLARAGLERAIHTRRGEGYLLYVHTEGRD